MNADGTNIRRVTDTREWDTQPAWSPDGKQIAFASRRDKNWDIHVINVDGGKERNLTYSHFEDTPDLVPGRPADCLFIKTCRPLWYL